MKKNTIVKQRKPYTYFILIVSCCLLLCSILCFSIRNIANQPAPPPGPSFNNSLLGFNSLVSTSSAKPLAESITEATTGSSPNSTTEPTIPPDDETPALPDAPVIKTDLYLYAINPGYTGPDGTRDVGEFIELRKNSTVSTPLSLAGYSLRYTNTSGTTSTIYDFPAGSSMTGENILLRLARSPEHDLADLTYSTTLAISAGPLELLYHDEVIDSLCWTGKTGCSTAFKSANPTSLVRDLTTGKFAHQLNYLPNFDPAHPSITLPSTPDDDNGNPADQPSGTPHCQGLRFSEIHAYYANDKAEQFIELYNPTDENITLDGCNLKYKKKTYPLAGQIFANTYLAYYPNQAIIRDTQGHERPATASSNSNANHTNTSATFSLTKNPNTSNVVELYDEDASRVDVMEYYHGQKKSTAYARFYDAGGEENWQVTYALTPAAENVYQEFRSCPDGKIINPATGNCVNATVASALKECPAGKYRSPITGRCRNLETSSEPKPCAEGYERNPETNRCRKVTKTNAGADYALVPTTRGGESSTFIAIGAILLLSAGGICYVIFQYRREFGRGARRISYHISSAINKIKKPKP